VSHKKIAEEPYQVPIWVITFSDMTTNLLTFFVLLMSMGHIRDETLFDQGQASTYLESVKRGFGFKEGPDFGNVKIKYFIAGPGELSEGRTIDAKEEEIRRVFEKVNRSMTAMPAQIVAGRTNFSITNIRFSPQEAILDESAKRFLTEFCLGLQQNADPKTSMLYVLGLADEQLPEKQQWLLSARRAQAAADFLQSALDENWKLVTGNWLNNYQLPITNYQLPTDATRPSWRIYWWGAGPGGDWVGQDSPISRPAYGGQILIAVLKASD